MIAQGNVPVEAVIGKRFVRLGNRGRFG